MNGSPLLPLLALFALGCAKSANSTARSPEPGFLRATPIVEHGPPSVPEAREARVEGPDDEGAVESSVDGAPSEAASPRISATALPAGTKTTVSNPTVVIDRANAMASQAPEADGFLNAVMKYTFVPGGIYKVFTAPENVTDLVLEPGEEVMGEPAAGDTLRWRLGVGTSAVSGIPQKHIFIKPTRAGLSTNLTINSNRRTYFLKLESLESTYMVAVQWDYPQSEAVAAVTAPAPRTEASSNGSATDVASLHFDYAIEVVEGKPAWTPQTVFDDGIKTYIRFDPSVLHRESPALFVIERGEMQLVNYRVKKNLYIVDRLFKVAELRLGQDDQDVVRLRKK